MPKQPQIVHFTVEGRGTFPVDMLRYDTCWPRSQEDTAKLERVSRRQHLRDDRPVRIALSSNGRPPTAARWASFGWKVIE